MDGVPQLLLKGVDNADVLATPPVMTTWSRTPTRWPDQPTRLATEWWMPLMMSHLLVSMDS